MVSHGKELWSRATADDADLPELVRLYWKAERGQIRELPVWTTEVANTAYEGFERIVERDRTFVQLNKRFEHYRPV